MTQADIKGLEGKVDQLMKEMTGLKRHCSRIEKDNEELKKKYDNALKEFRQDSNESDKSLIELKKSLENKRNEFNNKKGAVNSDLAKQELERNKARWEKLNEIVYSIEKEFTQVREQTSLLATELESLTMQERELKNKIELVKTSPTKSAPFIVNPAGKEEKKQSVIVPWHNHAVIPNSSTQISQIISKQQPSYQPNKSPVEQPKVFVPEAQPVRPPIEESQYNTEGSQEPVPPVFASQKYQVPREPQLNSQANQVPVEQAQPPAASVPVSPKKPAGPESPSEIRYKNCLSSISGIWHEDDTILVTINRSVNIPMKSAAFKVTFENKLTDTTLHIKGLELLGYDDKGKLVK
jgi:predicted  nucleic acid-binding Zn-ribbon protein